MKNKENHYNELVSNKEHFFKFMRERYPVFYNSNIFLRDIQYAIKTYFDRREKRISYEDAEKLMTEFTTLLESNGELVRLNYNSWKVNFTIN